MLRSIGLVAALAAIAAFAAPAAAQLRIGSAGHDASIEAEVTSAAHMVCNSFAADDAYALLLQSACVSDMVSATMAQLDAPAVAAATTPQTVVVASAEQ